MQKCGKYNKEEVEFDVQLGYSKINGRPDEVVCMWYSEGECYSFGVCKHQTKELVEVTNVNTMASLQRKISKDITEQREKGFILKEVRYENNIGQRQIVKFKLKDITLNRSKKRDK